MIIIKVPIEFDSWMKGDQKTVGRKFNAKAIHKTQSCGQDKNVVVEFAVVLREFFQEWVTYCVMPS